MTTQTMHSTEPRTRKWSLDEYYQMADLGWFQDQRVELIEGEIIETPAQRNTHVVAADKVQEALRSAFGKGYWVRMQAPLHLGRRSAPEPDAAVVKGFRDDIKENPSTALLVVEVSDRTLSYDAGNKANLYASASIADYWIVNLVQQRLEVRREPIQDPTAPFGHRYSDVRYYGKEEAVSPLGCPHAKIPVADLLP